MQRMTPGTMAPGCSEANIVFINGLRLEEPTRELAEANVQEGVPIVELAALTIPEDQYIYDFSFPDSGGDPNPHLWTNPLYALNYARIVKDELSKVDPDDAEAFASNFSKFEAKITELDREVREVTETVPRENRVLLTHHDSFPYFARDYGWTVIGDPARRLRRADPSGGGTTDRPDRGRAHPGDLRIRGVPGRRPPRRGLDGRSVSSSDSRLTRWALDGRPSPS